MNSWVWRHGELVKRGYARVGDKYPIPCKKNLLVCDPLATSFGDECGVSGCEKIS